MVASPDPPPPPTIGDHLLRLLETQEGADVTFQVGKAQFAAHTLVLSARSPVFRALLSSTSQGGAGGGRRLVRIDDTGATAFAALLHFAYGDELPPSAGGGGLAAMRVAGELLGAANRYGMERMALLCERSLREGVVDAATALVIADRHGSARLKTFCVEYVAAPEVLREAVRTEGYAELKASHPVVVTEILERVAAGLDKDMEDREARAATKDGNCIIDFRRVSYEEVY